MPVYKMDTGNYSTATQQMDKVSQYSPSNGPVNASDISGDVDDPEYERRLVRKLDKHIVPVIMLLYLFSFLDRYVIPKKKIVAS